MNSEHEAGHLFSHMAQSEVASYRFYHKLGQRSRQLVTHFVDVFFDGVFGVDTFLLHLVLHDHLTLHTTPASTVSLLTRTLIHSNKLQCILVRIQQVLKHETVVWVHENSANLQGQMSILKLQDSGINLELPEVHRTWCYS